jgi:hypothetical protein
VFLILSYPHIYSQTLILSYPTTTHTHTHIDMVSHAATLFTDIEFSAEDAMRSDPEFLYQVGVMYHNNRHKYTD